LSGVGSAAELLDPSGSGSQDRLSLLKQEIADLLTTSSDNFQIITLRDVANTPGTVDVTYAAHGSPYYTPVKLDTLVWMNRQDVSSSLIVSVVITAGGCGLVMHWHRLCVCLSVLLRL